MRIAFPAKKRGFNPASLSDIAFLLIIFLILTVSIDPEGNLDLPSFRFGKESAAEEPAFLTLDANAALSLSGQALADAELEAALLEFFDARDERIIHLRADKALPFSKVNALLKTLNDSGYSRIVLVAEPGTNED